MNEILMVLGWLVIVFFAFGLTIAFSAEWIFTSQHCDTKDKIKGHIALVVILAIWWFVFHIAPFSINVQ